MTATLFYLYTGISLLVKSLTLANFIALYANSDCSKMAKSTSCVFCL